ncbi:hypothetical protein CRENBAI_026304 [Crenichthys baileyi]|uniref:Uncharacterized protein n=1 Tax=Crenichthys baileyi TaxID=28760 RepID=A0AAV9R8N8_9TELE
MMVDFSGTSVYPGPSSKICCPALGDESASRTPTTGAVSPLLNACPSVFDTLPQGILQDNSQRFSCGSLHCLQYCPSGGGCHLGLPGGGVHGSALHIRLEVHR